MKITPADSTYQRTLHKNVEFCIFLSEERSRMRVYLFAFFLTRGDHIDPVALESREWAHSNGNKRL
jgi:hypothetical protein